MAFSAVVMAGGRGSRLGKGEKPLLKILGKPMIEHVIDALKQCREIERIIVAVSRNTPNTALFARRFGAEVLETAGYGYVEDLQYVIRKLLLRNTLVVSADMPCLKPETISNVISNFKRYGKPALSAMVPADEYRRIGIEPEIVFKVKRLEVSPAGINVIDGSKINADELDQQNLIIYDAETLINVNTPEEFAVAERLLSKTAFEMRS